MKINVQTPVSPPLQVRPNPPSGNPGTPAKAAGAVATPPTDSYHLSLGGKTNGQPAAALRFVDAPDAKSQFGSAVHVDKAVPSDRSKLLGFVSLTDSQEQQVRAAESRAFDRFLQAGNDPARGSLQAKLSQSARNTYQPGLLEHSGAMNVTPQEREEIMDALQDYGEDLASIAVTGRSRRDVQRYAEDKFFITLFDRDKDELEDYVKGGFKSFTDNAFGRNSPDNDVINKPDAVPSSKTSVDLPTPTPAEAYRWRFLKPRVGVSLKGTDFKEATIKPKVDLVRLNGPAETEVRVIADVPFSLNGKYEPKGEIYARRILNHKPGEYGTLKENVFAEGRSEYNFNEQRLQTSVGVRKQISPDASMGFYGLYSHSFSGGGAQDLGLGVNYQSRFD